MAEEKTHNWTSEETQALIEWRAENESLFTGKRNSCKTGWEDFVSSSGLAITVKQAQKKWNNLKAKYKELRDPPTGKGVEEGSPTAATWQWYKMMDAVLHGQHSISPPLLVAANLTSTAGGAVSTPASSPSTEVPRKSQRERPRDSQAVLQFLKDQAEREEERERQALAREEERERAATERADRYLSLFEKLVEKF